MTRSQHWIATRSLRTFKIRNSYSTFPMPCIVSTMNYVATRQDILFPRTLLFSMRCSMFVPADDINLAVFLLKRGERPCDIIVLKFDFRGLALYADAVKGP